MICIDEEMASKVGLEAAAVYYYMRLILCTKMYQESFKGCMVKREKYTGFIAIAKLKELIPFLSIKKIYNAVNRLVEHGYIRKVNYKLPGMNTTKCYQYIENN